MRPHRESLGGRRSWLPVFLALAILAVPADRGIAGPGPRPEAGFAPLLGVCTSAGQAAVLKGVGCDYVEESVQGFLVPDRPEGEFQAKLEAMAGSPLPILACNSFLPGALKSVGPNARPGAIIAYAETAFRRARRAGIKIIVFGSGASRAIPDGFGRAAARRQFIGLLRRLGRVARKHGLTVAVEPLQKSECNFINTVTEGAGIVREAGHPRIRLLADIYHMLRENEGPESLVAAGAVLAHCHVAEKDRRTPPGTAGDDFRPFFRALRRIRYRGAISMEGHWEDMPRELPPAVENLRSQIAKANEGIPGE